MAPRYEKEYVGTCNISIVVQSVRKDRHIGRLDIPNHRPNIKDMNIMTHGTTAMPSDLTYDEVGARCKICGKWRGRRKPTTDRTRRATEMLKAGFTAPYVADRLHISVTRVNNIKSRWCPEMIVRKDVKGSV